MATVLRDECSSSAKIIGGVDDHVHVLLNLSRTETVAHVVEMVKKRSSKWIKTKDEKYKMFQWQTGYGIFSVSGSGVEAVTDYIANQKTRHANKSFKDEYRGLLRKYGVEYDERYVWD